MTFAGIPLVSDNPITTVLSDARRCGAHVPVKCLPHEHTCIYGVIYITVKNKNKWGNLEEADQVQWILSGCYAETEVEHLVCKRK